MAPLAAYLQEALPGLRVEMQFMQAPELQAAVASKQVDFVWTNPAHFLILRSQGSLTTLMATTIALHNGQSVKSLGGVIITQAHRLDLHSLSAIKRQRIGLLGQFSLGGHQSQAYEFHAQELPFPGTNTLVELGTHDEVIRAVLEGRVDVGFIRTGILEPFTDTQGPVTNRLRVVHAQAFAGFPFAVSTRLYPEWPFLALAHVDDGVVRQVAARLLALESSHPAAVAASIAGFSPSLDYLPVENLARELRLPPFDTPPSLSLMDIWDQHRWIVLSSAFALACLLALILFLIWGGHRLRTLLRMQIRAQRDLLVTASVFACAREGIVITDTQAHIIDVNAAFTHITGYTRDEVIGLNPRILSAQPGADGAGQALWAALLRDGMWQGELLNRRKSGEPYFQLTTITLVQGTDGKPLHYVSVFSDVTLLKQHEHRLRQLAYTDELTGLPNRTRFNEVVSAMLPQVRHQNRQASVAYLDLDGFKEINDRHGHHAGDLLLTALAHRLQAQLGTQDTLARLGGDEFVILLSDHQVAPVSDSRLLKLLEVLSSPVELGGLRMQVSGTIGVVNCCGDADEDVDYLIRLADQAMYQAKQHGRNCYRLFDRVKSEIEQGSHDMRRRIAEGLVNQEFVLYYQPKVNLRTGEVLGVEALIRWQHPELGLLAPAAFLGHVAGYDIDHDIGRWVIGEALDQMQAWLRLGLHLPVSVNVSGEHLQHDTFLQELRALLIRHPDLPDGTFEIEVLESSAIADTVRVSEVIRQCAGMGVTVALDDFGTGYSSLSYLRQLPAQTLKIDQSFIRSMLDERDDLSILQGVLGLAQAFDKQTVAEGIETPMHGLMLLQLGCERGQGYGIARPMPALEMPLWLTQWQPSETWREARLRSGLTRDLLVASVHWLGWLKQLNGFLSGTSATPPALNDPVSPLVVLLEQAHRADMPEGALFRVIEHLVDLSHRAVAFKLAGRTDALASCRQQLDQTQKQLHDGLVVLGYWI